MDQEKKRKKIAYLNFSYQRNKIEKTMIWKKSWTIELIVWIICIIIAGCLVLFAWSLILKGKEKHKIWTNVEETQRHINDLTTAIRFNTATKNTL